MFKFTKAINKTIKNVSDSIRFMSKSKKRTVYYSFAGLSTFTATGVYTASQTIFLDNLVEQIHTFRYNFQIPVDTNIERLFHATLNDVFPKSTNEINDRFRIFNFIGCDMYCLGSPKFPYGASIGVPFYLSYTDIKQIKVDDIRLLGKYKTKRKGTSPVIQKLFTALILSEDAKQYAIAHQINLVSSPAFFIKSVNIALCTASSFIISKSINSKIFSLKQILPRFLSYCVCFTLFTVLTGTYIDQLLDEIYDYKAMKKTISLGEKYQRGAKEFYEKLIQRNIAIFELLGQDGRKFFTEDGKVKKAFGLRSQSYEKNLILVSNVSKEIVD